MDETDVSRHSAVSEKHGTRDAAQKYGGHKEGDGQQKSPAVTGSPVPEKGEGKIQPSAPNDSSVTPGSVAKQ